MGCAALARPICFESRESREAQLEDYERRTDSLLAKTASGTPPICDARLCGVWTYTAGDIDGCYLIGRHGSTMFYYEEGLVFRLFGILQQETPRSGSYIVILNIGTLKIRPSSGNLISELKPWNDTAWHGKVTASSVVNRPTQAIALFPVGSQDRLADSHAGGSSPSAISPLDFALAAEKVGEADGDGQVESSIPLDVSGKWEIFEQTSGKFIFMLWQNATGAIKGKGRSCEDPASDWSILVHGKLEGRTMSWTEYVSTERGKKPDMEAGKMVAIISPCGRFFGGFGSTDGREGEVPQHFAGAFVRRHRGQESGNPEKSPRNQEPSTSKKPLNLFGKEKPSKIRIAGSVIGDAFRSFRSQPSYEADASSSSVSSSPRGREDVPLAHASSEPPPDQRKRVKVARSMRAAVSGIFGGGDRDRAATESLRSRNHSASSAFGGRSGSVIGLFQRRRSVDGTSTW